jgi:hypothetical protein
MGPILQFVLQIDAPTYATEAANHRDAAIGVSRRFASGSSELSIRDIVIQVYDDVALTTLSVSATLALVPAGNGTVITGSGTNSMIVSTGSPGEGLQALFDLRLSEAGVVTRYVTYAFRDPSVNNGGIVPCIGPVSTVAFI